jgi:hypothetical protein
MMFEIHMAVTGGWVGRGQGAGGGGPLPPDSPHQLQPTLDCRLSTVGAEHRRSPACRLRKPATGLAALLYILRTGA